MGRAAWGLAEKRLALRLADDDARGVPSSGQRTRIGPCGPERAGANRCARGQWLSRAAPRCRCGRCRGRSAAQRHAAEPSGAAARSDRHRPGDALSRRQELDRDAGKPAFPRSIHAVSRLFETSTLLIAAMQDLLGTDPRRTQGRRQRHRRVAGGAAAGARDGRVAAGRERAQIAIFLAASGRAARRQLTSADYNRHRAVSIWQQMQSTLAGLAPQPRLTEQTRLVQQKYFSDRERVRGLLLTAVPSQQAQPMTAARMVPARNPCDRGHDRVRPQAECPRGREVEPRGLSPRPPGAEAPGAVQPYPDCAGAISGHLPMPLPSN